MMPTLKHNDYIITSNISDKLRINTIVVCNHQKFGIITKRIYKLLDKDYLLLKGDNEMESSSPETLGKIHKSQILGKHLITIKAPLKNSSN